ncbi:exported hypothetical protein [Hyphomicrobiales bacterium]|nr:exported hypothetical protein [Hyphomicrobiales bacterium]CAH1698740.1 exported hypothetical protein [Hyphomicrobiales bacterium]CAI0342388.1 exported hypothetical protein [Hyphomicrobiales bacterium]
MLKFVLALGALALAAPALTQVRDCQASFKTQEIATNGATMSGSAARDRR